MFSLRLFTLPQVHPSQFSLASSKATYGFVTHDTAKRPAPISAGAEIGALHLRIVGEFCRGAGQNALADLQHGGEIRNLERELNGLLREQDGQPFRSEEHTSELQSH